MANIALDIRANTQKALGEFKKLSRELDNKFLVQGLKLDVVKSAFSQINREFQNAVGTQGLKTAETTGQLKRSLSAALFDLGRFNTEAAASIASGEIVSSLQKLRAEGEITGETFREALNISAFLDFDATGVQLQQQLSSTTNRIAQFVQKSSDIFGGNQGQLLLKGLTGQLTIDQLSDLDFNLGGNTNQVLNALRKNAGLLQSQDLVTRTEGTLAALAELESLEIFDQKLSEIRPIESVFRKINGLFSDTGAFGALRVVGGVIENFDGTDVNRNLIQVTGKLLRTIFDTKEGVFAKLNQALQEAFGDFDVLEPILSGAEFLTELFEKLGNFFKSSEFQSFLDIFDPIVEGIKNIIDGGLPDFSAESINDIVSKIFDAIRGLFNNITKFILSLDASAIGSVIGNIVTEILKTIPSLFTLILSGLGKALQVATSNLPALLVATLGGASIIDKLLGGVGLRGEAAKGLRKLAGGGQGIRGLIPGKGAGKPQFDRVSGQRLDGFQSEVLENMRTIISIISKLNVQGDPLTPDEEGTRRGRQRPQSSQRTTRTTPRNPVIRFLRGGIGDPGGFINRTLIGPRRRGPNKGQAISPELSARFAQRYGTRGILARGAARIAGPAAGILGGALGALQLGSIFAGAGRRNAQFEADDTLTKEQKEFFKKENQKNAREQAGAAAIGMAGGALGGILGSFFGGPAGTFVGASIGNMLGNFVADILGPGVTEAVGGFIEDIGNFFGNLWSNVVGFGAGVLDNIGKFFGPEGPIQSIGKFLYEIPGDILETIKTKFEEARKALVDLPGNIVNNVLSIFGDNDNQASDIDRERNRKKGSGVKNNNDDTPSRFLGGAGSGMTLVGENGPELVNLGSGANVIPNSSLMGGLFGNLTSQQASAPVTNIITINVNAPGADEFAETLRDNVIIELNNQFEQLSTG